MAVKQTNEIGKGKPGPGRPKGSVNRVTKDIREAVLAAFEGAGGSDYLIQQAHDNPQAFMTLLGKCMPAQVAAEITGKLEITRIERRIVDPANTHA